MHHRCLSLFATICLISVCCVSVVEAQDDQATITGTIDDETPFVEVPLLVEQDDSTIVLDLSPSSGGLDTLLYLVDGRGSIVAENDDRTEGDTSSRLVFPQAQAGQYTVIATRYKVAEGDTTGDFQLTIDVHPGTPQHITYRTAPEDLVAAGYPPVEPHTTANWTVLVYYGADTNLEPGILNDFNEFEIAGGSDTSVRVAMLIDRHPGYYADPQSDWDTARLFEVNADVSADEATTFPPTIDSAPLAELAEQDTSYGETLAQFLVWGISTYPAERYAVVFGSHGGGWQGLITDDSTQLADEDALAILSIPELRQALALAVEAAGVEKFDLLINDACSMSSVEYYAAMAQYFEKSIASPEIVVDPALDMTQFIQILKAEAAAIDLDALGKTLVDTYITRDILLKDSTDYVYYTHALTDLTRFDPVVQATERFAGIINANPAAYTTLLGQARANTYTYTYFMRRNTKIDLGHFMQQVIALADDTDLILAAEDVIAALDAARIYGNAGERVAPRTSYYNIYFPQDSKDFDLDYFEESQLPEWTAMLRGYYNAVTAQPWTGDPLTAFHPPVAPKINITKIFPEIGSTAMPFNIAMEVVGRSIAQGTFTVDRVLEDGTTVRLETSSILTELSDETHFRQNVYDVNQWHPGVELSTFYWDATLPRVTDGTTTANELVDTGGDLAALEGRYRSPGSEEWVGVAVLFSFEDGSVQRVVSRDPGSEVLGVIQIPAGSTFQVYRAVVTPDGRVSPTAGNEYAWPEGGLRLDAAPAPSGQYNLGFLLTTFGGTTGFGSAQVTVDNDAVDTSLTGYSDIDIDVSLVYPVEWETPAFSQEGFLVGANLDGSVEFYVEPFEPWEAGDLAAAAQEYMAYAAYDFDGTFTPTVVDGSEALMFDYGLEAVNGYWSGRGYIVWPDEFDWALVLRAEVLEGAGEFESMFQLLHDRVTLIAPSAIKQVNDANWTLALYDAETYELSFPVRSDWYDNEIGDGDWEGYQSPDGASFALIASPDGDDAAEILPALLDESVAAGVEDYELVDTRTYRAERHTWEAARYTAVREDQEVTGRVYVTVVGGLSLAMWFETPTDEQTPSMFAEVFEPMLDGCALEPLDLTPFASGEFGFKLEYPVTWELMQEDWGSLITANPAGTAEIWIVPVYGVGANLKAIVWDVLDDIGVELDGAFTRVTVGGQDALAFDIVANWDGEVWLYKAFALYNGDLELGLVVLAGALEGESDPTPVYQMLLDTFERWWVEEMGNAVYPLPETWPGGEDESGIWRRYTPDGKADSATFVAVAQFEGDAPLDVMDAVLQENVASADVSFSNVSDYGGALRWEFKEYTVNRAGQLVVGDLFATTDGSDVYVVWTEVPVNNAWQVYQDVIEPMIIGFTFPTPGG